jgi:hypothetical protein
VKLFQIEEPDGGPSDPEMPDAAIGIDASGAEAVVAMAVGGNAVVLDDREGFVLTLSVPAPSAATEMWQTLFEGARLRAERALARPVTHAVIVVDSSCGEEARARLQRAAEAAGIAVLRLVEGQASPHDPTPALTAAILAEDLQPRPEV